MSYRRVVITQFGGPEVLKVVEEPVLPEPGPGEVRVRVLASSAAFTDVMIRKGKYPDVKNKPPFTPGYDMVGLVDKLGEGVNNLTVNQMVADLTVIGAYAEYICWPASSLVPVPEGLDAVEAVSLVLSYVTAYQMLYRVADIQPCQRFLIHGASGAVGTAMLQLGRLLGLQMYGTASKTKHELVTRLGATPIDYRNEDLVTCIRDLTGGGVDVVFDGVGGNSFKKSFQVLRPGGVLVAFGFYNVVMGRGGSIPLDFLRLKLWDVLPNGRSTTLYSIAPLRKQRADWFQKDLSTLFDLLAQSKIQPVIDQVMPLDQAARAHELVESGSVSGKIVLRMNE